MINFDHDTNLSALKTHFVFFCYILLLLKSGFYDLNYHYIEKEKRKISRKKAITFTLNSITHYSVLLRSSGFGHFR